MACQWSETFLNSLGRQREACQVIRQWWAFLGGVARGRMLGLVLGMRFPGAMARLALVWGRKTMTETGKELCMGRGVDSWDMVGMRTKRGFVGHLGLFSGPVATWGVAGH